MELEVVPVDGGRPIELDARYTPDFTSVTVELPDTNRDRSEFGAVLRDIETEVFDVGEADGVMPDKRGNVGVQRRNDVEGIAEYDVYIKNFIR